MDQPAADFGAVRTPFGARTPPQLTSLLPPPPPIPDHELLQLIGRGSYGQVWLARNRLGTLRAVKIVSREAFEDRKPFEREFKGIQRFEPVSRSHEGLVDILQVGGTEEYFYYVMELADEMGRAKGKGRRAKPEGADGGRVPTAEAATTSDGIRTSDFALDSNFEHRASNIYEPRTLRAEQQRLGRLPVAECVRLGRLLASALGHLHRHNLVHRDVKPSNIIFVEGAPKLADIGLVADLSEARSFVGTEGFIPPEGPGTPQGDLYSLGKVLYEISTGLDRRDFPALPVEFTAGSAGFQEAPKCTSSSGIRDQESGIRPPASGINSASFLELNAVIAKACQADPAQRYRSAEAMEVDLAMLEQGRSVRQKRRRQRGWAIGRTAAGIAVLLALVGLGLERLTRSPGAGEPATTPEASSIFVLPFRHSVPDPLRDEPNGADYDECLCNRLTDAFIDAVPLIPGASTGPRKSGWRGYHEDQVRRTMVQTNNTRYILTGRVDHTNEVLRLALRLYERRQDTPLWTETIEASINDTNKVIALEKRAIAGIASRLRLSVDDGIQRTIDQRLSHNLAAYHLLLRARSNYFTGFRPDWPQSVEHCQSALKLDPRYTAALVGWMLAQLESSGESPPRTYMWTLETGARELLAIDDTLEVAHDRLVFKHLYYDYNWERGGAELEGMRARGFAEDLTLSIVLRTFGRMEEAYVYHDRLKQHLRPGWFDMLFIVYGEIVMGNYDEAIAAARRMKDVYPQGMGAPYALGRAFLAAGRYAEAIEWFRKAAGTGPGTELRGLLGRAYALAGDRTNALEQVAQLEPDVLARNADPYHLAWIYAGLGQKDEALDNLERAVEYKSAYVTHADWGGLRTDQAWEDLRDEPRFEEICQKVGMGKDQWPR